MARFYLFLEREIGRCQRDEETQFWQAQSPVIHKATRKMFKCFVNPNCSQTKCSQTEVKLHRTPVKPNSSQTEFSQTELQSNQILVEAAMSSRWHEMLVLMGNSNRGMWGAAVNRQPGDRARNL